MQLRISEQRKFKDQSFPFPFTCAQELQVLDLQGRCWRFNFQNVCTRLTKLVLSFHCDMEWSRPKSIEDLAMLMCITKLRKIRFSGARSKSSHILDKLTCLFPRSSSVQQNLTCYTLKLDTHWELLEDSVMWHSLYAANQRLAWFRSSQKLPSFKPM